MGAGYCWVRLAASSALRWVKSDQYGSRISLADQGNLGVAGESGAFVEPS